METEVILDCIVFGGVCYYIATALYEKHRNGNVEEAIYNIAFACFLAITLSA